MHSVRQLEDERRVALDARMPSVALTGLAEPGDRLRALMAGFQVQDLQDTRARVEKVGGRLQYASDQPSAEGTTNITDPIHGVVFQFTQAAR